MVTDRYSHILDENRRQNAQLVEKAYYQGKGAEAACIDQRNMPSVTEQDAVFGNDAGLLMKVLSNPKMIKALQMLLKTVG